MRKLNRIKGCLLAGTMAAALAIGGTGAMAAEERRSVDGVQTQVSTGDGIVETTGGLVQGTNLDGVYRYLGVPYAQAEERFVPAEAVEPWDGVFQADSYGTISPQGSIS